jgi:hypothetical protein
MGSRILISSQTLGSSAASVTFSSIPSTYTDLVLRTSVRESTSAQADDIYIVFNGNTSSVYSYTYINASNATVSSSNSVTQGAPSTSVTFSDTSEGTSYTANTFASGELYIPNYTSTSSRPISSVGMTENNNAQAGMQLNAILYRGTSAITSMALTLGSGSFAQYSTFALYGIKSS